uniref:Uncharacterized protein n=1 Tax=Oryza brachyantha TaxID=4533 RepID=J3LZB0_ORYBR
MHSPGRASLLLLCAAASLFLCGGGAASSRHNIKMTSPYAPQLTRWREMVGGVARDFVEHEGEVLPVSREDCIVAEEEDRRDFLEIGGKLFPVVDEAKVTAFGGRVVHCVGYSSPAHGVDLLLTVTEGKELAEVVSPDGVLRLLGRDCFADPDTGTVQHVVDVEGRLGALMLLVTVREELERIVCIKRLN